MFQVSDGRGEMEPAGAAEAIEAKLHGPDAPVLTHYGAGRATREAPASVTAKRFNGRLTFTA
jgi:hypothetical protein